MITRSATLVPYKARFRSQRCGGGGSGGAADRRAERVVLVGAGGIVILDRRRGGAARAAAQRARNEGRARRQRVGDVDGGCGAAAIVGDEEDRKSTRLNSSH